MPIPLGILAVAGAGAADGGGAYDLLETTVLGTAAASVTFSNLNNYSNYKHLQVRLTTRTSRSAIADTLRTRLNSDSGSNYALHRLYGDGSTAQSEALISLTSVYNFTFGNNATANVFSTSILDILDFSSSSKTTTLRFLNGAPQFDGGAIPYVALISGLWNNTAAVTSIEFSPFTGPNFVSGSRFSLYGVK